jgi:hypothetical protein
MYDATPEPAHGTQSLRVIVLTYKRHKSLARLLTSLHRSDFLGERVALDVWVDAPPRDAPPDDTVAHQRTIAVARRFTNGVPMSANATDEGDDGGAGGLLRRRWPHGEAHVHVRTDNAGLREQWLHTWRDSVDEGRQHSLAYGALSLDGVPERALILEDDISVSPHFWRWLRWCHAAYGDGRRADFAGCTLQRASLCAKERCPNLDGGMPPPATANFMYPLVGSWGFSPDARHWASFTHWADTRPPGFRPYVEGLQPTGWYHLRVIIITIKYLD